MLMEMKEVRQIEGEGLRRWFTDEFFDLFVWYETKDSSKINNSNIIGFQLCYDKSVKERALTWKKGYGYTHDGIDDGENRATEDRTPILVKDGLFDTNAITNKFLNESNNIDQDIVEFVVDKIQNL